MDALPANTLQGKLLGGRYWFLYSKPDGTVQYCIYKDNCLCFDAPSKTIEDININYAAHARHYIAHLSKYARFFLRGRPVLEAIDKMVMLYSDYYWIRNMLLKFDWTEQQLVEILKVYQPVCSPFQDMYILLKQDFRLEEKYSVTTDRSLSNGRDIREMPDLENKVKDPGHHRRELISDYVHARVTRLGLRKYLENDQLCDALDDLWVYLDRPVSVYIKLGDIKEWQDDQMLKNVNWCIQNAVILNSLTAEQECYYIADQFQEQ